MHVLSTRSIVTSLLVIVALSGCLGAPVDDPVTDGTASYSVSNEADELSLVTVSIASELDGFVLTFANGSTTRYPAASSIDDLPPQTVDRAVSVVPLGSAVETFSHRLGPGDGVGSTVEGLPRRVVVVYTIAHPARDVPMRAVGVSSCGVGTTELTLEIRLYPDGNVDSATTCAG